MSMIMMMITVVKGTLFEIYIMIKFDVDPSTCKVLISL